MKNHSSKLIHSSIIFCLILMLIPWTGIVKMAQPYWLALALIYWSIESPRKCGLMTAFFYSILLDVLYGGLLGKFGFSMVALVFIIGRFHKRLKMTSFWQLTLMIGALLINDAFIRSIIDLISQSSEMFRINFWTVISSTLVWPWFKYVFDRLKQKY